jgi:hypothetical protein
MTRPSRSTNSPTEGHSVLRFHLARRAVLMAALLLVLPLSGSGYAAQSDNPMAPDFDPLAGVDEPTVGDTNGDTDGSGAGSDGTDESEDDTEVSPGDFGAFDEGGEGAVAQPPAPRTASSTRRSTPARRTTTTRRTAPRQAASAVEDFAAPDPSLSPTPSPSPSPTPSLSPLTTPSPTSSPFFSGALDEGQNTSDEGSSMLPVFVALLLALGLIFMFVSGRRRRRFRPGGGGHSLLRR